MLIIVDRTAWFFTTYCFLVAKLIDASSFYLQLDLFSEQILHGTSLVGFRFYEQIN